MEYDPGMRLVACIGMVVVATTAAADPAPPAYEKVNDSDHAIAGMPGWDVKRVKDANRCGGYAIAVKHTKQATKGDEAFAALLSDAPPTTDLGDFEKNFQARAAWSQKHQQQVSDVLKSYLGIATKGTGATKLAAVGRIVQLEYHLALLTQYAELPKGSDSKEARDTFCNGMAAQTKPAFDSARADLVACAGFLTDAPHGWWNDVCR